LTFERQVGGERVHGYVLTASRYRGDVAAATANTLTVTGDIPAGDALRGRTMIVTFGDGRTLGLPIDSVEAGGEMPVLQLQMDPGFEITDSGAKLRYFPLHEIAGGVTYTIAAE
jgi:hypothetical protein